MNGYGPLRTNRGFVDNEQQADAEIQFGLAMRRADKVAEQAQAIEKLGYDYVTTGEHVFFHVPCSNAFISLAVAAGATTTLKLMSTITLLPLYPAVLAAKQAAALDVASGGRFHMGIGVGGELPREFEASGVPVSERGARTNEALEIMKLLFNEDDVHFDGRFNQLSGVTLEPKPLQQPSPPIWISGRKDAAWRRAARFGTGWLPYMYTPEMLVESNQEIAKYRSDEGNDSAVDPGLFIFFCCHEDNATAVEYANQRLSKQYNQDFSHMIDKYAIAGDPDRCAERLREYVDAGARTIILSAASPMSYVEEAESFMAQEVLPRFRQ
ncbi:MAG: LLM class flavin-dependent oxidoreductase [Actinomycetota bacterium]|nr:LLM class flavin-dependent oxidoreductase [Actinomycetota bacterium]MED5293625.1 LLM class flavin-dependent oxidoreductase [Actinomycetota bacterium]